MELKIDKKWIDDAVQQAVDEVKKNYILIPIEGMTNGEVLKSIFPTAELLLGNSDYLPNVFSVKEEWWNSPYQKGGEE